MLLLLSTRRALLALTLGWLLSCALALDALGQAAPMSRSLIASGERVRITSEHDGVLRIDTGTLARITDAGYELRAGTGEIRLIPRDPTTRLEVRRGSHWKKGLTYGALIGLALGVTTGFADGDDDPGIVSFSAEEKAIVAGGFGLVTGGVLGVAIGATQARWVSVDERTTVVIAPLPSRELAIGARLSF